MVKVLILDTMLEQINESAELCSRINRKLEDISQYIASEHSVNDYLKKHNGKKIKNAGNVWKFRLSRGERILYTYGRYVNGIRESDAGCIVLLSYSVHEEQAEIAQNFDWDKTYSSKSIDEVFDNTELNTNEVQIVHDVSRPYEQQTVHHRLLVIPSSELKALSETDLDIYLSDEQEKCVEAFRSNPGPMLVIGGAGTGKTMIALHILADFEESQPCSTKDGIIYFTQSSELQRCSRRRYMNVVQKTDTTSVEFNDITTFCENLLEYNDDMRQNLVTCSRFINEFPEYFMHHSDTRLRQYTDGIDWLVVWTEIRGIIKGQLDSEWHRNQPQPQQLFGCKSAYLVESGWLKRCQDDDRLLELNGTIHDVNARMETEPPKYGYQELIQFINYCSSVDCTMDSIGEKAYLSLDDECSTVPQHDRKLLWDIFLIYQKYLKERNLFDENDLVRKVLENGVLPEYSFVAIDEVQDYTELELYLAHSLCSKSQCILYAGDGNQNVNPALFREDHLRRLYMRGGCGLTEVLLTKNYRNPDTVVRATNSLSILRSSTIATKHAENEVLETAIRSGIEPYRLRWSSDNLSRLLLTLSKFPSTALLVPDTTTKDYIISVSKEIPELGDTPFIYTISEIKGMEYKYVVCYNLISRYVDVWTKMLSRNKKSYNTGERYYFNLLYVAMTRSQCYLGFIDENICPALEVKINPVSIEEWDEEKLHFTEMLDTSVGWFNQARQSENNSNYDDAIKFYKRAKADNTHIRRCQSKSAINNHSYIDAYIYALLSDSNDLVQEITDKYSRYIQDSSSQLARILLHPSGITGREQLIAVSMAIAEIITTWSTRLTDGETAVIKSLLNERIWSYIAEEEEKLESLLIERMDLE